MKKFLLMALLAISAMSCSTDENTLTGIAEKQQVSSSIINVEDNKTSIATTSDNETFNRVGQCTQFGYPIAIAAKNILSTSGYLCRGMYATNGKDVMYADISNLSTFTKIAVSSSVTSIKAIAYSASAKKLYIANNENQIFSMDDNNNWAYVTVFNNGNIKDIETEQNNLLVLNSSGQVYKAIIGGNSFFNVGNAGSSSCFSLASTGKIATYGITKNNAPYFGTASVYSVDKYIDSRYYYDYDKFVNPISLTRGTSSSRGETHYVLMGSGVILKAVNMFRYATTTAYNLPTYPNKYNLTIKKIGSIVEIAFDKIPATSSGEVYAYTPQGLKMVANIYPSSLNIIQLDDYIFDAGATYAFNLIIDGVLDNIVYYTQRN